MTGDRELLRPIYERTVRSLQRAERDAVPEGHGASLVLADH
jgi:hypothetical protein